MAKAGTIVADATRWAKSISLGKPKKGDWTVQNRTPYRIQVDGRTPDGSPTLLTLAPLEVRTLPAETALQYDFRPFAERNRIVAREVDAERRLEESYKEAFPQALGVAILLLLAMTALVAQNAHLRPWVFPVPIGGGLIVLGANLYRRARKLFDWRLALRLIGQVTSLLFVFAVGIGLPLVAFYHYGGGRELLLGKPSPFSAVPMTPGESALTQLSILLLIVFIALASLLPALLFFLFDRERLGTLQEKFYRQALRLDPAMETLTDVEVRYQSKIREYFGIRDMTRAGRILRGTRLPVLLASLAITLGWILTLLPNSFTFVARGPEDTFRLFIPQRQAMVFAFLGAYFFALMMILRRYARNDLRPKTYSHVAARILIVVILAWVLETFWPEGGATLWSVAFLTGVFPESGLTFVKEFGTRRLGFAQAFPSLQERQPLTDLEDIDLYDRTRLDEEGVTNVEGLAHHDLLDLILQTRISVPRLVDWVDQAILYIHAEPSFDAPETDALSLRARLRTYGIRTATDLIAAHAAAKGRSSQEEEDFLRQLGGEAMGERPHRILVLMDTLKGAEWLPFIQRWRETALMGAKTVTWDPRALRVVDAAPTLA